MSRSGTITCERVRKQAYRYRRGELLGVEVDLFDTHLVECVGCCDYYERLGILLDAASEWEPDQEASDPDDLFAEITAKIDEGNTRDDVGDELGDKPGDELEAVGRGRWTLVAAGLAAGIALTLGALFVVEQLQSPVEEPLSEYAADQSSSTDEPAAAEDESKERPDAFASLVRQQQTPDDVAIFASEGATWSLAGEREMVLDVQRGTLLVEFVPEKGRTLMVQTPDFEAEVVGTVFYVTAESGDDRVGVVVGEIEVSREGSERTTLGTGRELDSAFEAREMTARRSDALSRYVDADEHRKKLAEVRAESEPPESTNSSERTNKPEPATTKKRAPSATNENDRARAETEPQLPPDLDRLRSRAERATREAHYQEAVRHYRALLSRLQSTHPIAASVHLDLAQIYLHRLNSPGRAAPHLRTFVDRWPTDIAAPSARRQLCEIAEMTGVEEPSCEGEQ